ncbi:MAG: methionine adenosyltransferase, partial [Candidatus Thermoplasmatota archaeon]|nr:methionine adenosyltransferase [Candidatus Thermoplasmatota archaeon]
MAKRNIEAEPLKIGYIEDRPVELVERKGIGHPDSICDGISESVSRALSRMYKDRFGRILHHNTDETHVIGGEAEPAFGGGKIISPATVVLVGRATTKVDGESLPYKEVAMKAATDYLKSVVSHVDVEKDLKLECRLGQGSVDLRGVFAGEGILANDTSFGCGFAPFSETETLVLQTEKFLTTEYKKKLPALGEDVKVMGCRRGNKITLTIAAALVGGELKDPKEYHSVKEEIAQKVLDNAAKIAKRQVAVNVNTGDDEKRGVYYLTVTGLSMENGDDGSTGRGNRANGLITPYRPMSLEAASGKNPVNHVGKIYNVLANQISADIVK